LFGLLVALLAVAIVPIAVTYFVLIDGVMISPRDGYWHLGMAIRGRFDAVDRDVLREHAMGWAVKGFFLPIMVIYLLATFDRMQLNLDMLQGGQVSAIRWLVDLVSCAELAIVCVGYTLTLRALDSHIRSTNPYLVGWLVTLACYQPFNHIVSGGILAYSDGRYWFDWFGTDPVLSSLWCAALLASFGVWLWATAAFGLRWSNLTNRGIITNGPYRFTKHLLLADQRSVPVRGGTGGGVAGLPAAGADQCDLLPARAHGGAASGRRSRLCRLCQRDERAEHLPAAGPPVSAAALPRTTRRLALIW
jgi:hypothetical protein